MNFSTRGKYIQKGYNFIFFNDCRKHKGDGRVYFTPRPFNLLPNYIKKNIAKEDKELILSRAVTARIIWVQYWKSQKCLSEAEWLSKL